MPNNIDTTLLEVRKAYRLLFDYQSRILDLMSFIGSSFNYDYNGGFSKFSNSSPRQSKGSLDCWAWDWLNMYYYEFHFGTKNNVTFSVFLLNDTGYFQNRKNQADKLNVNDFDSVENSKTKLIFVVGKNTWDGWGINWDQDDFILQDSGSKQDEKGIMLFKSYLLNDFFNEENAIQKLKDFETYCKNYDVIFKYNEKTV